MGSRPPSPSRSKSRSRSRSPARTSTTATTAPGTSSSPSKQQLKKPNDADHDAVIRYSRDELLACQPAGFLDKSAMLHDTFQTRSKAELLAASNASGDRGGGGRGDPLARKGRTNSNATRPDSLDVTRGAGGAGGDRRKYTNRSPSPGGTRHHRTDRGDRGGGGAHQRDRVNSTGNNNAGGAEQSVLEKLASLRQFVPTDRDRDRGERSGTYERRDRNAAAAANDERGASDQRRRDFGREFAALGERRRNPDQYPNPTLDRYFDWEADQDKKNDETFGDDAGTEDFDFLANDFDPIASYKAEMRARDGRRHIESAPEEVKADPIAAFRQMMKQASHDDVEGDALEPEGQETSDTADFAAAPAEARPMGRFGRFFAAMEESPVATPAKEEPTPVVQEQSTPITSPQGGESDNKGSFAFIMQRLSGANVGGGDASGVKQAEPMAEPAVPRAQPVESVPDRLPSASPKAQLQQQQQQQQSRQLPSPTGSFPAPSREGSVPPPSTAGGQPISPSNNMPLSGPHMPQGPIPGLPPGMHPDHYAQHQAIMRQQFLMQQAAAAAQRAGQPQQHHQHPQQQQQQQQQQPARPSGNMDPRDQHILDVQRRQQQLMLHHHHQQLGGVPPGVAPYPGYPNQPPPPPTEQDLLEAAARERAIKKKAQQLVAQGAPTSVTRRMVAAQNLPRPPPPHMAGQPGGAGGPYPPGSGGAGYHPQNAAAAAAAREAAHAAIMEQLGRTRPPHQGNAPHGGPSPPHPSHMQGPPPPHMIYGPPPPHMMGPPPPGSAGMRPRAPLPPNAADAQSALYNFLQQQHHHQQQAGGAPPNTSGAPGGSPTSGTPPPRPMHPGMPGMQQRPPGMPPGMPPPPPFMMGGPPPPGMPPHIMYGPPPPGTPPHMMYGPPQGVPQGPPGMLPPHLQAAAGGAGQRRE